MPAFDSLIEEQMDYRYRRVRAASVCLALIGPMLVNLSPVTAASGIFYEVRDPSGGSGCQWSDRAKSDPIDWPEFRPESDFSGVSPALRKPGFLGTVRNTAGYCLTRLGGSRTEMTSKVPLPPGGRYDRDHRTHWYSRSSASSAGGRYVISWIAYDLVALWRLHPKPNFVAWLTTPGASKSRSRQVIWDKKDDASFWWTRSNQLMRTRFDERTFETFHEVVHRFAGYATVTFGDGEGDISADGSKVALQGRRPGDDASWLIAFDIGASSVVGERRLAGEINAISVDPTGSWLVWNESIKRERFSVPWGDLDAIPFLFERSGRHGDFVVDRAGVVWLATTSGKGVKLWRVDRDNQDGILHWSVANSDGHISGIDRVPGKFTYTRYNGGQIILFDTAQRHRQAIVGYTRHCETDEVGAPSSYSREPRGSVAMDGRYIVFSSEWCGLNPRTEKRPYLPDIYTIDLSNRH